jgi:hypothetical protein
MPEKDGQCQPHEHDDGPRLKFTWPTLRFVLEIEIKPDRGVRRSSRTRGRDAI